MVTWHLHVAAAAIASVILVFVLRLRKAPGQRGPAGLGVVLLALGLYFFPLGSLEAYDWTRRNGDLDTTENAVFWYAVTTASMLLGALLVYGARR